METEKYRALLKAAERGSITAAAYELGYSPSGLTRSLDSLEKDLGISLLSRTPQGVSLTSEGERLLPGIREMLYGEQRIMEEAASLQGLTEGELVIGSYYSIASLWLPDILKRFQEKYPGIRFHVEQAGNKTLQQGLLQRRLHCCLLDKPENYPGDWIHLYWDQLMVWLPKGHPLAKEKTIQPEMLDGVPFINPLPQENNDGERYFAKMHVHPDVRFTSTDMYTCWKMVEAGLGICIDDGLSVGRWPGDVEIRPLSRHNQLDIGIALPSIKGAAPALRKFIQAVQSYVKKRYPAK